MRCVTPRFSRSGRSRAACWVCCFTSVSSRPSARFGSSAGPSLSPGASSGRPAGRPEDEPGDNEGPADEPKRAEGLLETLVKQHTQHAARDRPDREKRGVTHRITPASNHPRSNVPKALAINHEDRAEGCDVEGNSHEDEGLVIRSEPDEGTSHREMPGARNRQELREPLHQPEHDSLPQRHATLPATSDTMPTIIAPLSNKLFRSIFPVMSRLATSSTVSWANRART